MGAVTDHGQVGAVPAAHHSSTHHAAETAKTAGCVLIECEIFGSIEAYGTG